MSRSAHCRTGRTVRSRSPVRWRATISPQPSRRCTARHPGSRATGGCRNRSHSRWHVRCNRAGRPRGRARRRPCSVWSARSGCRTHHVGARWCDSRKSRAIALRRPVPPKRRGAAGRDRGRHRGGSGTAGRARSRAGRARDRWPRPVDTADDRGRDRPVRARRSVRRTAARVPPPPSPRQETGRRSTKRSIL